MEKSKRSPGLRALNAICAIVLISSVCYFAFAGFKNLAVAALVCSVVGVSAPVVVAGEGLVAVILGIFEALLDGIVVIFEAIASIFSGIFG